jgi:hypothetical protein
MHTRVVEHFHITGINKKPEAIFMVESIKSPKLSLWWNLFSDGGQILIGIKKAHLSGLEWEVVSLFFSSYF